MGVCKEEKWVRDKNGDMWDIFHLPKGKHLVFESIIISEMGLTELPDLSSVEVGLFDCSGNKLTSLIGSPKVVKDEFKCHHNQLESFESTTQEVSIFVCHENNAPSLEGMPQNVCSIICGGENLKILKGCPPKIKGYLRCASSSIVNLDGAPQEIGGDLHLRANHSLENLKGGPQAVGRSVEIEYCTRLTSLEGSPKKVGSLDLFKKEGEYAGQFSCIFCGLESLEGAPDVVYGTFAVNNNSEEYNGIKDLKGSPKIVYGRFLVKQRRPVRSLEGAPTKVAVGFSTFMLDRLAFDVSGQNEFIYNEYIRGLSISPEKEKIERIKDYIRKKQMMNVVPVKKFGEDATEVTKGRRKLPDGIKLSKRMRRGEFNSR